MKSKKPCITNALRSAVCKGMFIASILVPAAGQAPLKDSEAERIAEARILYGIMDLPSLVDKLVEKNALASEKYRSAFRSFIRGEINWSSLEETIVESLVKNFSAPEIKALAGFQGSHEGKSIIEKYPAYLAEIGTPIQAELRRVLAAEAFSRTRMRWDSPVQELAAGPADESVSADFVFRNDGPKEVRVLSVTTSCGCTAASLEKTAYQPGEQGTIRAIFTVGSRAGFREEKVYVTTDEPGEPKVTLQFKITISEPLKIAPRLLVWEAGEKAASRTVEVEIPPGQKIEIIGLESLPGGFSVEKISKEDGRILQVRVVPSPETGASAGKFFVLAAAENGRVIRLPVYLRILPPNTFPKNERSFDLLWIDARPEAENGGPPVPGAVTLTEDAWDAQFEAFLARWTPGQRVVLDCPLPSQAGQIVRKLKAYGVENVFVLLPTE